MHSKLIGLPPKTDEISDIGQITNNLFSNSIKNMEKDMNNVFNDPFFSLGNIENKNIENKNI
jgi:hypothetical protein